MLTLDEFEMHMRLNDMCRMESKCSTRAYICVVAISIETATLNQFIFLVLILLLEFLYSSFFDTLGFCWTEKKPMHKNASLQFECKASRNRYTMCKFYIAKGNYFR